MKTLMLTCVFLVCGNNEAARILAYYPTPSISHQVVFRPLTLELVKRGHEVVVITTDPIFQNGDSPTNIQEIDVHDISYAIMRNFMEENQNNFDRNDYSSHIKVMIKIVEEQMKSDDVKRLINDKTKSFDLVIIEALLEPALGITHLFKAPLIQFSSFGGQMTSFNIFGASTHPLLYPTPFHERLYNLTVREKLNELYYEYNWDRVVPDNLELLDKAQKRIFGNGVPSFLELRSSADLLFLNVHSVWDSNRPVPPNVIYLGGFHQKLQKDLPQDLQTYLDSSENGVVYVSFGSNIDPALFSAEILQALVKVFSKLPYDVLWKWNHDELPGQTPNIKISKWLPQSDLLRHPKIKLFLTQGGLQSTDEAITAAVPLVGIPVFGDQKYNVEQYLHFGIGERVEIETITEEKLSKAINAVLQENRYRENVAKLRSIMNDQPQSPLERAIWWTEYVIRHKGAKHLRSPAANMSLAEYLELKLISYVVLGLLLAVVVVLSLVYSVYSSFRSNGKVKKS